MKRQKKILAQVGKFFDELFQDSRKLRRVARWLTRLAWLALITVPLIIVNNVLFFFNMQTALSQGFMFVGNTPKPVSSLNVTDILEMLGPQVLGMLKPVVFWLGVFLLLHITRRILSLVFDIKNAARS